MDGGGAGGGGLVGVGKRVGGVGGGVSRGERSGREEGLGHWEKVAWSRPGKMPKKGRNFSRRGKEKLVKRHHEGKGSTV